MGSENGFQHSAPGAEAGPSADADFEARVAAAMSLYDQPVEEKIEPEETGREAESKTEIAREAESAEPPASFEYSPPVNAPVVEIPVEAASAEKVDTAAESTKTVEETPAGVGWATENHTADDAPIPAKPMQVSVEATQVIPVYLEPPAEPPQAEPAAEAPITAGPVLVTSEPTQVIPVYIESQAEPPQPGPAAEAPISAGPMLVSSEPTQVIPVYIEPSAEPPQPEAVAEVPSAGEQETSQEIEEKLAADIKAELPPIPDASSFDTIMISAVADRILDRLKPQLIEEISRELKNKKK